MATSPPPPDPSPDVMGEEEPSGIFGHSVFLRQPIVDTVRRFSPPAGYIVGPGDVFTITIYGPSELNESLRVTSDGSVMRQQFGKIYLAGMEFEQARSILELRYRRLVASRSIIEINLSPNPRSIGINIVGEVVNPGYHQIKASVPAFRAILHAGGVTDIGSVRNIEVRRNGRVVHIIDIYKYLLEGTYEPFFLEEDDVIFVPVHNRVVSISGAVARPMRYELTEDEQLVTLLSFAGGLSYQAQTSSVELRRLETTMPVNASARAREKKVFIINLDLNEIAESPMADYQLFDGDRLSIRTSNLETINDVSIEGRVEYPDEYQLFEGERISDLISRAGGLSRDAYLPRAYVVRINPASREALYIPIDLSLIYPDSATVIHDAPDNIRLEFKDRILIFSSRMFLEQRSLTAVGQVRNPGTFKIYPGMNLRDLLYLVGGFTEDAELASVELSLVTGPNDVDVSSFEGEESDMEEMDEITEGDSTTTSLVRRISIPENWQEDPSLDTIRIYDFNRMRVYSRYDFIFTRKISISGAVRNSGTFPVKKGMTLEDLLYLAGGLSEPGIEHVVDLYQVIPVAEKGNYGTETPEAEIERIRLVGDWRENPTVDTLDMTGYYRVVIRSEREFLQTGTLQVKGEVNQPGAYQVLPGMSLKDVLYMAGGLKLEANKDQIELSRIIEVIGENGEIIPVPSNIRLVSTIQDWENDPRLDSIRVFYFDQVFVRPDPDFRLQQSVFVEGEVVTPGEYNKSHQDERLSSLLSRANGITELAYLEGAWLERVDVGPIAIKLEKALRRPGSRYDLILREGDVLYLPARTDAVTITGNVLQPNTTVMYERGNHSFRYYVNLAGGFARKTRKKECTVRYVDGTVKKTRRFMFIRFYPRVQQGAVLTVPKRQRPPKEEDERQRREWDLQPEAVLSSATAILTFILLLDRAFQ